MGRFLSHNSVVGGLMLILSAGYLYHAGQIELDFWSEDEVFNARSMPYLFGGFTLICASLLIILPSTESEWRSLTKLNWRPTLLILVLISLYGLGLPYLGFIIVNSLFLTAAFIILGQRNYRVLLAIAVGLSGSFYFLMDLLGIYLDPGDWIAPLLSLKATLGPNYA